MTKHTCSGPKFGKLAPAGDCPRCDELRNGSPARAGYVRTKLDPNYPRFSPHNCTEAKCGPVCTFGDW